ncbi:hypothetical protein MJO28_007734 [Puccinia striiformis f. sp. tritici]|uniref:Uncharacterized protein n=4 Tax=Puccinia striiformis TaxID=27350 RepID=A0A0L0VWK0_9BASI|nr:hypothetical protein Pst134EB_014789 [Puccinia striiformis f. sp. tritici]KAI9612890.1 hypothetical protein KEM48_003965 [Puccinia striiformis f. sp. tritici PST-130]KNF03556.1 hypothetical protein PSTG_03083 [Puccinia striiformis f. sp. tritici PST-78]POW09750.1 hypothetical protein PSTT_06599 [Puccinia striiformis]KAI7952050.1 hypothetical protein MJO28_007734 [Puccinia striiformis f. sp. tritici]
MSLSNTILKFALLLSVALVYQLSGINANSIVSPKPNQTLNPGEKLAVVVKKNSTDSTDQTLAFAVGLSVYKDSLGRPFLRTVDVGKGEATWNSHESTYTFEVTVPPTSDFIDQFSKPYNFAVSEYYLKGPSNVPTLGLSETPVTIKQD